MQMLTIEYQYTYTRIAKKSIDNSEYAYITMGMQKEKPFGNFL